MPLDYHLIIKLIFERIKFNFQSPDFHSRQETRAKNKENFFFFVELQNSFTIQFYSMECKQQTLTAAAVTFVRQASICLASSLDCDDFPYR